MTSFEKDLIARIATAFRDTRLGDGISLNLTEFDDSGGTRPEYQQMAEEDERGDWQEIPDRTLEKFEVAFAFTDLNGYRFYLPAYMSWWIRNHLSSRSILLEVIPEAINPDRHQFGNTRFADWFTDEQVAVMSDFLGYVASFEGFEEFATKSRELNGLLFPQSGS